MATEDELARRAWFRQHILPLEPQLRQHLHRVAPRDMDVDDLVHDALVKAMSNANWRQVVSPAGFLFTVGRNLVYDQLRRRAVVPLDYVAELDASDFRDDSPDAEAVLVGREELRLLARLVQELPPQCRRVFTLRKIHDLSPHAIAERLGLSVSTVEKHLVKALRRCSEGLARNDQTGTGESHGAKTKRAIPARGGQSSGR
jgi:RNA polymerase sigma-70 factor (ECF subfamily)